MSETLLRGERLALEYAPPEIIDPETWTAEGWTLTHSAGETLYRARE
jgi:hypothetical protein